MVVGLVQDYRYSVQIEKDQRLLRNLIDWKVTPQVPTRPPYRVPSFILDVFDAVKRGDAVVTNWSQSQGGIRGITSVSIDIDMLGMPLPHPMPPQSSGSSMGYARSSTIPPAAKSKAFSFLWDDEIPEPVIQDIGKGTVPVVGYRDFRFSLSNMSLYSRNGAPWPKYAPLRGVCHPGPINPGSKENVVRFRHDAPDDGCSCGIYAFDSLTHDDMQTKAQIYGEVNLWGTVLLCESGFRAELAYPKRLFVVNENSPKTAEWLREVIEREYGVPTYVVAARGLTHEEIMNEEIKKLLSTHDDTGKDDTL